MSLINYIGPCVMLSISILLFYGILKTLGARKEQSKLLPDDGHIMDKVQEESYNGKPLWITEEERESWNAMPREQKRSYVRAVEKKIKEGELYVHTDETGFTGLISMQEAKEKGYVKQ